jgi:hypothetical protein
MIEEVDEDIGITLAANDADEETLLLAADEDTDCPSSTFRIHWE